MADQGTVPGGGPSAATARSGPSALSVLVIDDRELDVRRTVVALEADPAVEVVGEAGDAAEGIALAAALAPDVIVVALALRGRPAPDLARCLRQAAPGGRVVALVEPEDDHLLGEVLEAGVGSVVLRERAGAEVLAATRAVAAGGAVLTPVAAGVLSDLLGGVGGDADLRRSLALLASGVPPEGAADAAGCAEHELAGRLGTALAGLGTGPA